MDRVTLEKLTVFCGDWLCKAAARCSLERKAELLYGPFSYSKKVSQSNDTLLHFVEFSNVHNSDTSSNATQSNLVYKNV